MKKTLSSVQDLIVVIDRDMRIVTSNWKNCDSIAANEKMGNPLCYSCLMKQTKPCESCRLLEVFATGKCCKFEMEDPLDNKTKLIELSPLFDDNGSVSMVVRHAKDISECKSIENTLKMREKQQAAVAKLGQEGLAGADLDELMQESVRLVTDTLNVEYCRIMKKEGNDAVMVAGVGWEEENNSKNEGEDSKNDIVCYTLYSDCEKDTIIQENNSQDKFSGLSLLRENGIVSGMDVTIGSREDPYGVMNVHTTQRRMFSKDDMHFMQSVANVLAEALSRKEAEENLKRYAKRLEDANHLKVLFTDILTHDLLNPANIIRGFTEELIIVEDEDSKQNLLDKIHKNNERMIYMIESASKFIKLESIDDIKFEEQDFLPVLEKVIRNLSSEMSKNGIHFDIKAVGPYSSFINPILEEVFLNLLSNAIKFTPQNGRISISISDAMDKWKIQVTDTGSGINNSDREMIFERFRRADKGSIKGSGLGLAIAKRIVELHGGEIGVENNPIGRGSVFWFTIRKAPF
ncbi:GAF domain-containing sensor histidine kinase [Methanolobus sediminis]|uniref:histidine kinase n=1 Tax=Methanolobus sediminis TaxID=3072978 RepID=A0AA51UK41_9EURY|nr:GAF domain-containing sensor histidine kinase [Methanolobus sediminis]WMW23806.1 GAF domain-containing sensor histidine kinase [Methanolobus sediminis]